MKIPAAFIARFLRPARVSPVRLAGRLSPATADRIVATVASTPAIVSAETYLLAVAILAREICDPGSRHERAIAREVRRTRERVLADRVARTVRTRVASWHGGGGIRLESAGSIDDSGPRFVVRHMLPRFEPLPNADFMGEADD